MLAVNVFFKVFNICSLLGYLILLSRFWSCNCFIIVEQIQVSEWFLEEDLCQRLVVLADWVLAINIAFRILDHYRWLNPLITIRSLVELLHIEC